MTSKDSEKDKYWQAKEAEYLRLLQEADDKYLRLIKEHKEDIRNNNFMWIGWFVIIFLGLYLEGSLF